MVALRLSRERMATVSQVGFSALSKWTTVSPARMPVAVAGELRGDVVERGRGRRCTPAPRCGTWRRRS